MSFVSKFRVGDVVVTDRDIATTTYRGTPGPPAAPGWLWRIEEVICVELKSGHRVVYKCVAHEAPTMYTADIPEKRIARLIGAHQPEVVKA